MTRDVRDSRGTRRKPFLEWQMQASIYLIVCFFTAMAAWGALAPIGSAIVAPGVINVETHRKAIQHLEGGIVGRLLVSEGTEVRKDEVLIELSDVAAEASAERIEAQYLEALIQIDRLTAERDGAEKIRFSPEVTEQRRRSAVDAAMRAQARVLESRKKLHEEKLAVLSKRVERLDEERKGLNEQIVAVDKQIEVSKTEYTAAASLVEQRLIRRPRLAELERNIAQLDERRSGLQSSVLQAEQQILESDLRKSELASARLVSIDEDLRATQARAHELSRQLITAQDILSRTKIRAPINGTVVGLQVTSRGAVIAPGQLLMEIVPIGDTLVVEARLRPEEIEEVRVGLQANVVLMTLTRRSSHPIKGRVEQISADRLLDKLTGRAYYLVQLRLDPESVANTEAKPLAGMSADVFIQTGDRTPLAYLAAPIMRSFQRGMREK